MNGNEKEIKLPKLICMADVEEKEAEWLTPNYLEIGRASCRERVCQYV